MEPWIASLGRADAYADEPGPLTHLQTHLSHVFLGARHVYKLRKPVRFGFVDFSTEALRAADCAHELFEDCDLLLDGTDNFEARYLDSARTMPQKKTTPQTPASYPAPSPTAHPRHPACHNEMHSPCTKSDSIVKHFAKKQGGY